MRSSQWMARKVLEQVGFRWELRRAGDLKIGLWRKKFKTRPLAPLVSLRRIVLIPGFGDSSLSWFGVISALIPVLRKEHDELVLFEFPGFLGFLAKEKSFDSMEHLSTRVYEILDTLGPRTLIGHSLGGWLAALYAADCGSGARTSMSGPDKLILINPGGVITDELGGRNLKESLREVFGSDPEKGVQLWRKLIFGKEPLWFPVFASEMRRFLTRRETREFIESVGDEYLLMEKLANIRAEVRFVWGELDALFPPELAEVWIKHLTIQREEQHLSKPFALIIRGVGHSPHIESAVKTTAALARVMGNGTATEPRGKLSARWWRVVGVPELPD